ncbi:MAG: ABC transporter substrate-binding protein [Candidatus Bipolaricaulia bacterium]
MRLTRRAALRALGSTLVMGPLVARSLTSAAPARPHQASSNVLRAAIQPIQQTDPAFISAESEITFANNVYDYLVDVDADNRIQPRLARDWTVSDDGRTYRFQLAEGVRFHDGSPLTPADVVWTFERLRDPEVGGATADLYANIKAIEASGNREVTFRLTERNPFFLFDLSDNHAVVVPEGVTDLTVFNGTGPFRVESEGIDDGVSLAANENYFLDGQPKLSGLELQFFNDQSAAIAAVRGDQSDLVWRISNAQLQSLQGRADLQAIDIPTNQFDLVRMRNDQEPGSIPEVVQAMKLATDRQAIFRSVLLGIGAQGRDSPIGPTYRDYFTTATPLPDRDPKRARQLLREAGFPNGLDMTLHLPNSGNRPDFAQVLQQQWAEAGIDVELQLEPESIYYGEGNWLEVNLGITGWGHRPIPQFYVDVMLTCGAKWNEMKFCSEDLDQAAEIAGTTQNERKRRQAYAEIQRICIEEVPMVVPYFFPATAVLREGFRGFNLKPFPGRTDFRTVETA